MNNWKQWKAAIDQGQINTYQQATAKATSALPDKTRKEASQTGTTKDEQTHPSHQQGGRQQRCVTRKVGPSTPDESANTDAIKQARQTLHEETEEATKQTLGIKGTVSRTDTKMDEIHNIMDAIKSTEGQTSRDDQALAA